MNDNQQNNNVFIIISLFLIAIVLLMLLIQLIMWTITIFNAKKNKINLPQKTYEILLSNQKDTNITIKKVKFTIKFANYQTKKQCLKLKTRDFEEKTMWNCYQNLISIVLIKWKRNNIKTHITLITSTLIFYLSVISAIICTLIYYINLQQGTIDNINFSLLDIFSFIILLMLVLSWLIWTMSYEKLKKDIILLASEINNKTLLKKVKIISGYKTLFPGSELLI